MQSQSSESKIDVRIIVSSLNMAQYVSKVVNNVQLEKNYNIIVSSIIPTVEIDIVKKVVNGADILLIGGYGHDETYNILFNELKTDFNHISLFNYNNVFIDDESFDFKLAEKEILNSIIKSTLSYSLNLVNLHALENKLMEVTHNYNNLLDVYNQILKDYDILSAQNDELVEEIDSIKTDFSAFKLRYEDIYSKNILEFFNLDELWQEVFHEDLNDDNRIVVATNNFKPDNIIIGQGFIAAESKQKAVDWLNIVRTALIFVDDDKFDFSKTDKSDTSDVDDDYDASNIFEDFWD